MKSKHKVVRSNVAQITVVAGIKNYLYQDHKNPEIGYGFHCLTEVFIV